MNKITKKEAIKIYQIVNNQVNRLAKCYLFYF